jgi:hypothetical protein
MSARGEFSAEDKERMLRIARAFGVEEAPPMVPNLTVVASTPKEAQAKAS